MQILILQTPGTRDRSEKKQIDERNGVDEYWIVDAEWQEVTVFHLSGGRYHADEVFSTGRVKSKVLPALTLDEKDVFEA